MSSGWIAVGRLGKVRGIRGELVGEIYSSQPGRAEKLRSVTLELNGRREALEIEQLWFHGPRPIFKFQGIDSIDQAEVWQGADILVPEAEREAPAEGEYSHADLIGCRVLAPAEIGIVKGLEEHGGPALLKVEAPGGREILVPFARSICREIDVAGKVIRVDLPEGLLDI